MKKKSVVILLLLWLLSTALSFNLGRSLKKTPSGSDPEAKSAGVANATKRPIASPAKPEQNSTDPDQDIGEDSDALEMPLSLSEGLKQVTRLSPEQTTDLLAQAFALPPSDPKRHQAILALIKQLATTDPLTALQYADQITSLRDSETARIQTLEIWAQNDPAAAINWTNTASANETSRRKTTQLMAILRGYAQTDAAGAYLYAASLPEDTAGALRQKTRLLSEVIETQIRSGDLAAAQSRIQLLEDSPLKQSLMGEMVDEWAAFDPAAAAQYVSALGENATMSIKRSLIDEWSQSDPAAAAAWIDQMQQADPSVINLASNIIREWTRYDMTASADWLNALPLSDTLDRAVASYTFRAAQEDPATAFTWAESIVDDGFRERLMQRVASEWKSTDPASFTTYIEASDLSAEQKKALIEVQASSGGGVDWQWRR